LAGKISSSPLRIAFGGWDCAFALAQLIVNTSTVLDHEVAIVECVLSQSITERIVDRINDFMERIPNTARSPVIAGRAGGPDPARGAALLKMYRRFFSREQDHLTI
jgi:hypothetical protein